MRFLKIFSVMLIASLSGGCAGLSELFGVQPSPPATTVVDSSCDFRSEVLPADLNERFYEPDGRIKAGLSEADKRFAVAHKGNDTLRQQRCGDKTE